MDIIIKALVEEREVQHQLLRNLNYIESTHEHIQNRMYWFRHEKLKDDTVLKLESIQAEIDRINEEKKKKS